MLEKLFSIFRRPKPVVNNEQVAVEPPSPPTPEEEQKKLRFVFPETLVAYKAERAKLEEETKAAFDAKKEAYARLGHCRWRQAHKDDPATDAGEILKRRREEADLDKQVNEAKDKYHQLDYWSDHLDHTFRHAEKRRYLSEGVEICRTPRTGCLVRGFDLCRVVVKWREKIMLLDVFYPNAEYEPRETDHPSEYGQPSINWATESLDQCTNEELEAVARFQASMTTK
jgi:hypothetical protein